MAENLKLTDYPVVNWLDTEGIRAGFLELTGERLRARIKAHRIGAWQARSAGQPDLAMVHGEMVRRLIWQLRPHRMDRDPKTGKLVPFVEHRFARPSPGQRGAVLSLWPEVGQLLGMSRGTVYKAARANQIPGICRIGHQWKVRRAPLMAWLEGRAVEQVRNVEGR